MFVYEKKLQYPVRIKNPNPALAKFIISQYGGPDGPPWQNSSSASTAARTAKTDKVSASGTLSAKSVYHKL